MVKCCLVSVAPRFEGSSTPPVCKCDRGERIPVASRRKHATAIRGTIYSIFSRPKGVGDSKMVSNTEYRMRRRG